MLLSVSAALTQAADYPYLVFTNTANDTTALSIKGLTMRVEGTELQVTNADSTTTFILTDLDRMQFSIDGTVTALTNILQSDAPVEAYTLTGTLLGSFSNLIEAATLLDKGVYVITNGKNAQKIVVK